MSQKVERSESVDNTCPVCHDQIEVFAIGPCDHPVCYRCSTRMRVLCEQMDCPICRSQMPQVVFVCRKLPFKDISLRKCIPNRKYKIFFEDEDVEDRFLDLQEFRCKICSNRKPDKSFAQLQTHMRREHQLFACDLCVKHIKIFPFERKFYTRKTLAIHRRIGDEDDKSYKGHPLCEFCDTRYNDKDELLKHLRTDHFFCHFCDQHGSNAYYDQYPDLKKHFSELHYLCTEGECANPETRFTHAFISEIDLKAHKTSVHSKNLSKAQSREARTIELDFQLPPRRQGNNRGGITSDDFEDTRSSQGGRGRGDRFNRRREIDEEDADLKRAIEASKEAAETRPSVPERIPDPVKDFPTLSSATPVSVAPMYPKPTQEEEFPSLSASASSGNLKQQNQPPTKAYSSIMNYQAPVPQTAPVKKDSKPVSLGLVAKVSRERWSSQAPQNTEDEYPALGNSKPTSSNLTSNINSAGWIKKSQTNGGNITVGMVSHAQHNNHRKTKPLESRTLTDEAEFPSLGGGPNRNTGVFAKPFLGNSKNSNYGNKLSKSKTDKVSDDSFELPDSYYKAYEEVVSSEHTKAASRETTSVVRKAEPVPLPASINSAKEFPGLPAREDHSETTSGKKKKKKNKKTEEKSNAKPNNTNSMDSNASLSDIAFTLVQPAKGTDKGSEKQNTIVSKPKPAKQTDWFDNPPAGYVENSQISAGINEKVTSTKMDHSSLPVKKADPPPPLNEDGHDFPSLHAMSISVQQPRPPPGFSSDAQSSSAVSAPPGFMKKQPSSITSSPAPPPGFPVHSVYIQPPDFKTRNLKLIEDIREALVTLEDGFSNFKVLSGQFRQGLIDASDYYFSCQTLMGEEDFSSVFPELLALLPDIGKQCELWEIHQTVVGKKMKSSADVLRISQAGSKSEAPWVKEQKLKQCHTCGQVLLKQDVQHHQMQHVSTSDFPSLGDMAKATASGSNGPDISVKGAWIKAK